MLVPGWKRPFAPANPRKTEVERRELVVEPELTVCWRSSGQHCTCYYRRLPYGCCYCDKKAEVDDGDNWDITYLTHKGEQEKNALEKLCGQFPNSFIGRQIALCCWLLCARPSLSPSIASALHSSPSSLAFSVPWSIFSAREV